MSSRTRRLVFLAALILVVMLPAETILLRALVTPTPQEAVQDWVGNLDQSELTTVAREIQSYPFAYRRAIMRRLDGAGRSAVWRGHLAGYLAAHPRLDETSTSLIRTAMSLASPQFFAKPTEEARASVRALAEQLTAAIGVDETGVLLYRLGPPDGTFASFEPLAMRLENKVRGWFVASALFVDCNCSMWAGCFSWGESCTQIRACEVDQEWPMCGWFWSDECDGTCTVG